MFNALNGGGRMYSIKATAMPNYSAVTPVILAEFHT